VARRCKPEVWIAAALLLLSASAVAGAEPDKVDTIDELFVRIRQCWKPPRLPEGHPGMQITVLFTLTRSGDLFGKPRITFESPGATEADSIAYRTAVMETLQRCTPMPFTDGMGGAAAGKPIRFRFDDRRNLPKPIEKRAWLTTTTL
jgi:hypothetical protein